MNITVIHPEDRMPVEYKIVPLGDDLAHITAYEGCDHAPAIGDLVIIDDDHTFMIAHLPCFIADYDSYA